MTAPADGTGRVTLVGAGPGDPDLLTVRALNRLAAADLILYDALSSPEVRALALKGGMTPLLADGLERVNIGLTTLEEAIQAAGTMH